MGQVYFVDDVEKIQPEHIKAWRKASARMRRSKRLEALKAAVEKIPQLGIWDLMPSISFPGMLAVASDGHPILYLRPERGLYWYVIERPHPSSYLTILKAGERVALPDLIKALKHGG